jgi:hypothetical protein
MKRVSFVIALLFASASILQAQNSNPTTSSSPSQTVAQNGFDTSYSNAAEEFRGDSQVRSHIIMSLQDHHLVGVDVKVTDTAIDISGKLPDKDAQHLAHDIAAAYADGRKVNDHTTR